MKMKVRRKRGYNLKDKTQSKDSWVDATRFWRTFAPKFVERINRQINDDFDERNRSKGRTVYFRPDTQGERKIQRIYEQYKAIELQLKDILTTLTYLKLKRIGPLLKQNNISRIDYLRFNYENHLIRVASFPDILAILGDLVYETGLKDRYINWNSFAKHKKTSNLKCSEVLKEFVNEISNLRDERHRIVHFGGHKNEIIESINTHTFEPSVFKGMPITKKNFHRTRLKEIKKLESMIWQNYNLCLSRTIEFMDALAVDIEKISLE